MKQKYQILRLILGDQLNLKHSWFLNADPAILYVMMEVKTETDYVWHHIQKACAFFAAMENFAETISNKGFETLYLHLDHPDNRQNFSDNLNELIKKYQIEEFQYQLPDEYRLDQELKGFCSGLNISSCSFNSEHFYTTRTELADFFADRKEIIMESFYRAMRIKHHVLIHHDHDPEAGKWNFDAENRKKLPKNHKPNPPLLFDNDVRQPYERLLKAGVKTIGKIEPEYLQWPVNRNNR